MLLMQVQEKDLSPLILKQDVGELDNRNVPTRSVLDTEQIQA